MILSNELQCIIQLLQIHLGNRNDQAIQTSVSTIGSWNRFVSLVIRHRLVVVMYTLLKDLSIELPEEEEERLKQHFELERKKNFILNASLVKLNEVLEKEIKVLWFKGVVQSQRMYGNPLLRSYSDLDLFIDIKDLHRVDKLLRSQGYVPANDWTNYSKSHFSKYSEIIKEIGYVNEKTKVFIDVHWNLVFAKQLYPYSFSEIYKDAIVLDLHGKKVKTLSDAHNFFYLNIHGCFDGWKSLSQLFDITMADAKIPEVNSKFQEYLKENRLSQTLFFGVELSEYLFGAKSNNFISFNDHVLLFEDDSLQNKNEKYFRVKRLIRVSKFSGSLAYKIKAIEANIFYGDNKDLWRLPRQLFFLYYVSMPFRWLGRKIRHKKTLS
jgi:hypothetical protein